MTMYLANAREVSFSRCEAAGAAHCLGCFAAVSADTGDELVWGALGAEALRALPFASLLVRVQHAFTASIAYHDLLIGTPVAHAVGIEAFR